MSDPISQEYRELMNKIAQALDYAFNNQVGGDGRKTGFVLLVFPFGDDPKGRCNYISNGADRLDMIALFKEMVARFEGQPEIPTTRA